MARLARALLGLVVALSACLSGAQAARGDILTITQANRGEGLFNGDIVGRMYLQVRSSAGKVLRTSGVLANFRHRTGTAPFKGLAASTDGKLAFVTTDPSPTALDVEDEILVLDITKKKIPVVTKLRLKPLLTGSLSTCSFPRSAAIAAGRPDAAGNVPIHVGLVCKLGCTSTVSDIFRASYVLSARYNRNTRKLTRTGAVLLGKSSKCDGETNSVQVAEQLAVVPGAAAPLVVTSANVSFLRLRSVTQGAKTVASLRSGGCFRHAAVGGATSAYTACNVENGEVTRFQSKAPKTSKVGKFPVGSSNRKTEIDTVFTAPGATTPLYVAVRGQMVRWSKLAVTKPGKRAFKYSDSPKPSNKNRSSNIIAGTVLPA